jgi:threonine/homoserine/homoserine lactone efflux protein
MSDFFPAIPIGILLSFTIGPVFFTILETSISKGIKAAIFVDIGVAISDVVFFTIAYLSTNSLLSSIKENPSWYLLGGVLLFFYAGISLIKTKQEKDTTTTLSSDKKESPNLFSLALKGFLLNIINFSVLFFWVGVIIVFGPKFEMSEYKIIVFFSLILSTYLLVDLCKIYLARQLKSKLTKKVIKKIKLGVNFFILICGVFLIARGVV